MGPCKEGFLRVSWFLSLVVWANYLGTVQAGTVPPPNDACADAAMVSADTLSTTAATTDTSDPLQSCTFGGTNQNTNSVWYSFTAPSDGTVTANTAGSDYDTVLTAYTGSCGALSEIACNDDVVFASDVTSQVTFPVTAGMTYLLEPTHSFLAPEGGTLHFTLTFTSPLPCRGDCDDNGRTTAAEVTKIIAILIDCPCATGPGGAATGCPAIPGSSKQCTHADINGDGCISEPELNAAIAAIFECELPD